MEDNTNGIKAKCPYCEQSTFIPDDISIYRQDENFADVIEGEFFCIMCGQKFYVNCELTIAFNSTFKYNS